MLVSVSPLVELPAGLRKSRALSVNGIVRRRRTLSDAAAARGLGHGAGVNARVTLTVHPNAETMCSSRSSSVAC